MSYTLYEIWSEDDIGHLELVETTASKTEALKIAEQCLQDGFVTSIIYQETEEGDTKEIARLTA